VLATEGSLSLEPDPLFSDVAARATVEIDGETVELAVARA
jgi:hypothetical protein